VRNVPPGGAAAQDAIERADLSARKAAREAEICGTRAQEANKIVAARTAEVAAHGQTLIDIPSGPVTAQAVALLAEAEATKAAASNAASEAAARRQGAEREFSEAVQEATVLEATLAGLREQHRSAEGRRRRAVQVLAADFPSGIPADLDAQLSARLNELAGTQNAYDAAVQQSDTAQTASADAEASMRFHEEAEKQLQLRFSSQCAAIAERTKDLATGPKASGADALTDEVYSLDQLEITCDRVRAVQIFADQQAKDLDSKASSAVEMIDGILRENSVVCEDDQVTARVGALGRAIRDADVRADQTQSLLKTVEERLARKQGYELEINEKRTLGQQYQRLADELRQNRFLDFVLAESLDQLALQASGELRTISGNRYSLKAADGSFRVVDHFNADEERSVGTLSGGETFLASLSLALALATSITTMAGHTAASRLEAVFIDEGFGTLDPLTLDVVVDALERLQEGDRTVGVITHVPLLAERIPSGIAVERTPQGSRVTVR